MPRALLLFPGAAVAKIFLKIYQKQIEKLGKTNRSVAEK